MNEQERKDILDKITELSKQVSLHLDSKNQEIENIQYYNNLEFNNNGYGNTLGEEKIYVVQIANKESKNPNTYEIYKEDIGLIGIVAEDGIVQFTPEYIEHLKQFGEEYFNRLSIENIEFELPRDIKSEDLVVTKEEIEEHRKEGLERDSLGRTSQDINKDDNTQEKDESKEKDEKQETEDEKKEKSAEALGMKKEDIKSVNTINPHEKVTDKETLADIMPELREYEEAQVVYSNSDNKGNGEFTILGVKQNGERQPLNSVNSIEGTSTSKNVISVNEDGTEVTQKQVKGLFQINSRDRNDGIAVSIGSYGMMDIDYVKNVMDKESRRATPIRTKESENQRVPTAEVRENAGDSRQEVEKEGKIYNKRQEKGVDPQSLDGIDTDMADGGKLTLKELKMQIVEETLKQGEMSRGEEDEFIRSKISESGLELSEDEIEMTTNDIKEAVLDESRFPDRGNK